MAVSETSQPIEPLDGRDAPTGADLSPEQRVIRFEVVVSGIRCLLTYIVIPVVAPILGLTGLQREITIALSIVALGCIGFSIRRFFRANHRMRWGYAVLSGGLALYLLFDILREVRHMLAG